MKRPRLPAPVRARLPVLLAGAGVLAFLAWLVLLSFGSQWRSGNDGGGHALSKGATGYAGIVQLLRANGHEVALNRQPRATPGLLVLTPPEDADPEALVKLASRQEGRVLVVLPKWVVMQDPAHKGWVYRIGVAGDGDVTLLKRWLPGFTFKISTAQDVGGQVTGMGVAVVAPGQLRSVQSANFAHVLLRGPDGGVVLGCIDDNVCVLAEPDLLANHGLAKLRRAQAAVTVLHQLADGQPIVFDLTLSGFGGGRQNLGTLALAPPFLGVTALLLLAGLAALWAGWPRLGLPRPPPRPLAPGNATLVEGAANLIVAARRHRESALRLAGHVLERAALLARLPAGLDVAERQAALPGAAPRVEAIAHARGPAAVLVATQELLDWERDIANGRR
jgi:hypothetical protein